MLKVGYIDYTIEKERGKPTLVKKVSGLFEARMMSRRKAIARELGSTWNPISLQASADVDDEINGRECVCSMQCRFSSQLRR